MEDKPKKERERWGSWIIVEPGKELTLLLSHYCSSGGTNRFNSEREKHCTRGGTEEEVEWERNCCRNNNNKTAIEKQAAELVSGCKSIREGAF